LNKLKAIAPISIFGPIIKYATIKQYDTKIEIHENYQKRSMRNRTQILAANGILNLSIPLEKGKNQKTIKDVKISYDDNWTREHIMTLKSAYGSSPYFEYYFDRLEKIINTKHAFLFDLFKATYKFCNKVIGPIELNTTDQYDNFREDVIDLRQSKPNIKFDIPQYFQVFEDKFGHVQNLSILDAIFNLGPETSIVLKNTKIELSNNDH
jgi:hypothetical protein